MALAPPKCLATTTEVASEAGEVTRAALATEVEATVATATPAGAQEEEDTKVARGEAIEEEGTEEQAVATEEAVGIRGGAGGSYGSSAKSFPFDRSAFLSRIPLLLLPVCLPFQFLSTSTAL